jgi:signal transduction histidine kinase
VPGTLLLHVCDNGPGVPEEIRARLFEPFASRSPGGTGLGLAIVARIMAAHGGSVALTERAPWRTCFTLSFPTPT